MHTRRSGAMGVAVAIAFASGAFFWWSTRREPPSAPAPLGLRQQIVGEIAAETTLDSVRNVARLGDTLYAASSVTFGPAQLDGYGYLRRFVPALGRVRKILVEVDAENREPVVKLLRAMFHESTTEFAAAKKVLRTTETDTHRSKYMVFLSHGPVSAYLLAMLNDTEALPEMLAAYRSWQSIPMDTPYLFYSMHLLMLHHPTEGLSPEATAALAEYRTAAAAVPGLETDHGAAWNAAFDESDYRTRILGQGSLVRPSEMVKLAYYPAALVEMPYGFLGPSTPRIELAPLVDKIEAFVKQAHPPVDSLEDNGDRVQE